MSWLIEHAAFLNTTFGIGRDGKEPYRLSKGKSWNSPLYEFGEGVQWKPLDAVKHRLKLDKRLNDGVFLGVNRRTGVYFMGTPSGIFRARDVYRRATHERWDRTYFDQIRGSPWDMKPSDGTDEAPPRALPDPGQGDHSAVDIVPRRAKITKDDLKR